MSTMEEDTVSELERATKEMYALRDRISGLLWQHNCRLRLEGLDPDGNINYNAVLPNSLKLEVILRPHVDLQVDPPDFSSKITLDFDDRRTGFWEAGTAEIDALEHLVTLQFGTDQTRQSIGEPPDGHAHTTHIRNILLRNDSEITRGLTSGTFIDRFEALLSS